MSLGTVVQVIGPVVDVQFAREDVPKIYDALKLVSLNDNCFSHVIYFE